MYLMKGLSVFSVFLILAVFPPSSVKLQPNSQGSQSQREHASEAPKPEQLPIDLIKKTVLFFHTEYLQNGQRKGWDGTGFFIIESDSRLKGRGVVWLVTNKHIIRSPIGSYFDGVGVRLNTKAPTPGGTNSLRTPCA